MKQIGQRGAKMEPQRQSGEMGGAWAHVERKGGKWAARLSGG